jgi:hypothetical protein
LRVYTPRSTKQILAVFAAFQTKKQSNAVFTLLWEWSRGNCRGEGEGRGERGGERAAPASVLHEESRSALCKISEEVTYIHHGKRREERDEDSRNHAHKPYTQCIPGPHLLRALLLTDEPRCFSTTHLL